MAKGRVEAAVTFDTHHQRDAVTATTAQVVPTVELVVHTGLSREIAPNDSVVKAERSIFLRRSIRAAEVTKWRMGGQSPGRHGCPIDV